MAKREIKVSKQTEIKSPDPLKGVEREFGEANEYIIDQMAKFFRNQVLLELNKSTIEKFRTADSAFSDAQVGNFAKIYLSLAEKAKKKLLRRFSNDRLSKLSKKYTGKVNRRNADVFYNRVEKEIGISKKHLEATEGLTFQINAYQAETTQWIEKLRDETLQTWVANTLRDMAEGKGLDEILSQFDDMVEKRKNHAKMVARTQISTFNSLVTKARAQNLGIEKAVWVSAQDERTRPSHAWRDGKEFNLSEGLYSSMDGESLLPGGTYNCRCSYRLIIPQE